MHPGATLCTYAPHITRTLTLNLTPNTNTYLAPQADTDDCIRVAVRFAVGATVECLVGRDKDSGKDQWVRGKVGSRLGAPRLTTITTLTLSLT